MRKLNSSYWIIDQTTLEKLQVLQAFVDFVARLEETPDEHKRNAEEVKCLISNLDKPETFQQWCVCIDIYDPVLQCGDDGVGGGIYWKDWSFWFELGVLEIRIEERMVDKEGYQDETTIFYGCVNFNNHVQGERIWGDDDYPKFLKDAYNFRNYITGKLNAVEAEIEIWEYREDS